VTHEEFMAVMTRQMYIWRMARSQGARGTENQVRARAHTERVATEAIDAAVRSRALAIQGEDETG
jgi:hypothetical protein